MALLFDGTNDRVVSATSTGAPAALPYAVACVVRFTAVTRWHGLVQMAPNNVSRGFEWEVDDANHMFLGNNGGGSDFRSTGSVAANTWYFLGSAVNGTGAGNIRHYCYNLETRAPVFDETSTGFAYTVPTSTDDTFLGLWSDTGADFGDFLSGTLLWAAVYGRDYNSTAAMLALATSGPFALGAPTSFWDFLDNVQGGTSTTAQDRVNGNHGTLANFSFDANDGWRPTSAVTPWWSRSAHRVIRPQGSAPPPAFRVGTLPLLGVGR